MSLFRCSPFLLVKAVSFLMVSFSFFLKDRISDRQRDGQGASDR